MLAHVDGRPLTLQDALDTFQTSHGGHEMLVRGERAVRDLIGRLVEEQVFLSEALALGLDEEPSVQLSVDEFRLKQAELVFWRDEVEEGVAVSEDEVEAAYARTEAAASIVLIESPDRAQAEALRARVAAGEDMRQLAAEHSTHESRDFGGELPLVQMGALEPALDAAVFALAEPGALTPVVDTEAGAAFAQLVERVENVERAPREQALPTIRSILLGRAQEERRAELVDGFCAAAEMAVFPERVTRDAILGDAAPETVLARSAGEDFTLDGLRQLVDMDAVRAADAETVESAMRDLVQDWAERRAIRSGIERSGLLDDPEVQRRATGEGASAEEVHPDGPEEAEPGANASTSRPASRPARTYSMPSAIVYPSSRSSEAPASCMWYPEMEIELNRGIWVDVYPNMSEMIRIDGDGG